MNKRLRPCSYQALLAGARKVSSRVHYDQKGYAPRWEDNVLNGLPLADIASDFEAGAGRELDGKLCAAHSSAAFAVNTFGPWRKNATSLHLAGQTEFRALECPSFLLDFQPDLQHLSPHPQPLIAAKVDVEKGQQTARRSLLQDVRHCPRTVLVIPSSLQ